MKFNTKLIISCYADLAKCVYAKKFDVETASEVAIFTIQALKRIDNKNTKIQDLELRIKQAIAEKASEYQKKLFISVEMCLMDLIACN